MGLLGVTRVGLSSCSSHNPSAACLPEGVERETHTAAGQPASQPGLAGRAWSENSAPWLCHFGVPGSWPQSGWHRDTAAGG